jgi:electron transfer flavoprotein beta subunit
MKILVCIGNVPDTTTKIRFNAEMKELEAQGVQWVINPWDELALTRALELKEASGGKITKVTVANVGLVATEPTIRKALAMGADDAVRVDANTTDSYSIAMQLAEVIKNDEYGLIFCGIESSDFNSASVGGMLAELLEMPSVSAISACEYDGEKFTLKRDIDGGKETLEMNAPFVAIVQKGICINPRIPAMRGIMMARSKPLNVIPGAEVEALVENEVFELPPPKAACKVLGEEETDKLVDLLHNEAKVI